MAVYKIFNSKGGSIYDQYPTTNTGLDEVMEISTYKYLGTQYAVRSLIQFSDTDLNYVFDNYILTSSYTANIKLHLAYAGDLPLEFNIEAYPLYNTWNNGTGKFGDTPVNSSGVSWQFINESGSTEWSLPNAVSNITSSYNSVRGGGTWYTGSNGNLFNHTQSFELYSDYDLNIDITDIISEYRTGSITNNGIVIKLDDNIEYTQDTPVILRYFSRDTHTIYPPELELKWNDRVWNTGSHQTLSTSNVVVRIDNRGEYLEDSIQKVRVYGRPSYIRRTFATASGYASTYYFPEETYWALRDEYTNENIIDFDTTYTKLSADQTSNYFMLYLNGIQPQRFYRLLIKSVIDGSEIIYKSNTLLKVTQDVAGS